MKLVHPQISHIFKLDNEELVNMLVIENQSFYRKFLSDVYHQVEKMPGESVLSEDNKPIEIYKNMEVIMDPYTVDINKKILTKELYKDVDKLSHSSDFLLKTKELYNYVNQFVNELSESMDVDVDHLMEYDISKILKGIKYKFREDYESLHEKLIDYMKLVGEFEGEKCFVLVNVRDYITNEEIDEFYKTILYNKLQVLVLSTKDYPSSKYENKIIIDEDLCEI